MKAHGKGQGISINGSGGTNHVNDWKRKLAHASDGLLKREWVPLKSWPVAAHPRQQDIERYHAVPSRFI